jgi:hypothetical protein
VKDGKASNRGTGAEPQPKPETTPTAPNASMPNQGAGWASASPAQVMRTVAIALLTTAVVLGAFFLVWQVRTFVGWFVIALFLAAVLNPAVNWLQRRHRLMKRGDRAGGLPAHAERGERARRRLPVANCSI